VRGAAPRLGDRSLFSTLQARAYLNHAGISPLSDPVVAAVTEAAADLARRGSAAFGDWVARREALRETLAKLVGGSAQDVGFVSNTAAGLNAVAHSLSLQPGDGIALFEGEYPSNVVPFLRVAERRDLRVHWLSLEPFADPAGPDFGALEATLKRGVKLLSVSAVQFQTGLRMPLSEIAERVHAHGGRLCVDAVQACGAVPIDVEAMGIDYLVCGGHKFMMGPDGCGFLSIRPDAMAELQPSIVGAMSYEGTLAMLMEGRGHLRYDHPLVQQPRVFETGMAGTIAFAGLAAAAELLVALGPAAILAHAMRYGDALEPELQARGFRSLRAPDEARRSATLAVEPPEGFEAHLLAPALGEHGVVCGSPDGRLRFSPHWPNAPTEVEAVLSAVDAVLAR
jgi:selenocysteine lyase/cysteine desulfurase